MMQIGSSTGPNFQCETSGSLVLTLSLGLVARERNPSHPYPSVSPSLELEVHTTITVFYVGAEVPKPGPHGCTESTSLTELFLQAPAGDF